MTQLTGRVVYPGDPGWDLVRTGFALWADYEHNTPRVIVFCQSAQDVSNAVKWARENDVPIRPRAGRHNYEGWSSLVKDGIIIDVSDMDGVSVSRDSNTAVVGAGVYMLELFEAMNEVGVTFPGATGPSVGLAGLVLGGGFGMATRKFGLTCDNLLSVEMVTADGEIVTASKDEHPDLFWACQGGGGGNFGIATSFTFTVHPVKNVAVYRIEFDWRQFDDVIDRWQNWAPNATDDLTATMMLQATRTITMYGQYTADDDQLPGIYKVLEPMTGPTPPISYNLQMVPHTIGSRIFFNVDPALPMWRVNEHSDNQLFKSMSAIAPEYFPMEAIQLLRKGLEAVPVLEAPPSQPSMIQLLGGGGAPGRIAPDATAVFHRAAKFILQYDAYWTTPDDGKAAMAWILGIRDELLPYTKGAYVNYVDSTLTDYLRQYYGGNLERLVQVKQHYDPCNVFNFPQSIPTSLPGA